ncbi:MAG: transglycosylase domain-containing protein [Myxococcota bacterium]|nr:transglycosylase domain-containing protein [Myxococcota bacterium]
MNRRILAVVALIGAATAMGAGSIVLARQSLIDRIERELSQRGARWDATRHDWATLQWSSVSTDMAQAEHITIHLLDRGISVGPVTIGPQPPHEAPPRTAPNAAAPTQPSPSGGLWALFAPTTLTMDSIDVPLGDALPIADALRIHQPKREAWSITRGENNEWAIAGSGLEIAAADHTASDAVVRVVASSPPTIEATIPKFRVDHPALSTDPLPAQELSIIATIDRRDGNAEGTIRYGGVSARFTAARSNGGIRATAELPATPLADVADVFGAAIPEREAMTLSGTVGVSAAIEGPPWSWTAQPSVNAIAASGGVPASLRDDQLQFTRGERSHVIGPSIDGWVSLSDAGWFAEAAIAAEDIRFREHPGYDLVAIQEAIDAAPNEARIRGGSTITQQLVKNIFLDGRRTLRRKFRELLLSLALEDRMSKDGILQLYINVVEFGPNIRGIGQAADAWFLKRPDQLTPREAAFLSAILPAPNAWHERIARTGTPPVVVVDRILDRMRRKGVLSAEQHRRARTTRLRLVPP